ncbi:hypothetical protein GCM10025886_16510 [Tetragenococcus halophilus subsp. flandriensis]|nr:hypothetical protein GCM10025886_16510 [Tetragenococcus halophilus subsp. flandriensis]
MNVPKIDGRRAIRRIIGPSLIQGKTMYQVIVPKSVKERAINMAIGSNSVKVTVVLNYKNDKNL